MNTRVALASVLLTTVAAAGVAWGEPTSPGTQDPEPGTRPVLRGEKIWIDPVQDVASDARTSHISHVLFVNRCLGDCTINPGTNDARANTSSITGGVPRTFSEFSAGDEIFDQVIACVRDVYAPYGVDVVTDDPGTSMLHHEAILAGRPEEFGYPAGSGVGGVAPASCDAVNNVISFSFANSQADFYSGSELVEQLCWTVAQESAHSFGLPNHVYDCRDPMTYIDRPPCGRKYFRNDESECAEINNQGQFAPQPCACGIGRQNSHRVLIENFGASETPLAPPTIDIFYPEDGASGVPDNFSVGFTALDPRLIEFADVYVNGTKYLTIPGKDYASREQAYQGTMPDLPDGYLDIEVRAYSDLLVEGVAQITVLKGEPCSSADQCFPHMACNEGRCSYPPPSGELGDSCEYNEYCLSGMCAERDGDSMCSKSCTFGVSDACPDGLECVEEGFCWDPDAGGGCCAVAGGQGPDDRFPLVVLALFAAGVVLLRRRPRPRA